jgi:diguanylate cyclase (GGDEF)-like protein/putative nucleotidyltransferase with HDIG domain
MLDIDNLKAFNDKFGHIAGDDLLKSLSRIIVSSLRKIDISFRIGGDEFAIVLPDTDSAKAGKIINRIRLKWIRERRGENHGGGVSTGFSSGIAEFPKNAETQDSLVFLADAALYYSKKKGGHKITLVPELGSLSDGDKLINAIVDQVYALPVTVEAKESFGFGHFKRVADLSEMIGEAIGLLDNEIEDLHAASLLHDIGKIGISNEILTKPSKLTPQEWGDIKKHATEGAKIIGQISRISNLAPIVRHHHEWFNGEGYPDKLKGEEIPLCARIICIADAYDSMTTPRPYRSTISKEEALKELERFAGSQFDPDIVKVAATVLLSNY